MTNKIYYIDPESVRHYYGNRKKIEVEYWNGLEKIVQTYNIGDCIKTVIIVEDDGEA